MAVQRARQQKKITRKMLQDANRMCGECAYFENQEVEGSYDKDGNPETVGVCTFFRETGDMPASGARSFDKWCGIGGKHFKASGKKISSAGEMDFTTMSLEQLEAIDKSKLTTGQKGNLTKAINALK
jgi:hypothetical protein